MPFAGVLWGIFGESPEINILTQINIAIDICHRQKFYYLS
jgi:hypothetical protein